MRKCFIFTGSDPNNFSLVKIYIYAQKEREKGECQERMREGRERGSLGLLASVMNSHGEGRLIEAGF